MNTINFKRIDPWCIVLPKQAPMQVDAEVYVSEKIPLEQGALAQLIHAASLPGVVRVFATADIHVGYGVPIGAVVATPDFISPAAVGYDINCGMRLITTPWQADKVNVEKMARAIRSIIPLGEGKSNICVGTKTLQAILERGVSGLLESLKHGSRLSRDYPLLAVADLDEEQELVCNHIERMGNLDGNPASVPVKAWDRGEPQIGTLGGGNHFIEFQRIERVFDAESAEDWNLHEGQLILMIHSGSRGLGHEIGRHYMKLASQYDHKHSISVPSAHLAILPLDSKEARDYLGAMNAAANYAFANRHTMWMLVKAILREHMGKCDLRVLYDVAHNLACYEFHAGQHLMVHRKGATLALPGARMQNTPFEKTGQPVLIPGSMGSASWVLRGIPSGERSLFSTNHGAGRKLSRSAACGGRGKKKRKHTAAISDIEFRQSMEGVLLLCENPRTIKEEAPGAYKDIDAVIESVIGAKLAKAVARLKPLAVLKG